MTSRARAALVLATALSGAVVVLLLPGLVQGGRTPGPWSWTSVGALLACCAGCVLVGRGR